VYSLFSHIVRIGCCLSELEHEYKLVASYLANSTVLCARYETRCGLSLTFTSLVIRASHNFAHVSTRA
jgi:hypothetical protein